MMLPVVWGSLSVSRRLTVSIIKYLFDLAVLTFHEKKIKILQWEGKTRKQKIDNEILQKQNNIIKEHKKKIEELKHFERECQKRNKEIQEENINDNLFDLETGCEPLTTTEQINNESESNDIINYSKGCAACGKANVNMFITRSWKQHAPYCTKKDILNRLINNNQ